MRFRFTCAAAGAVVLLGALMPVAVAQAAATPTPPFNQCPAVGEDTSCEILLVVNPDHTISVLGDPNEGPYDGSDDTLVGIVNNSKAAVPAITVTGPGSGLSLLDGDGLCTYGLSGCPFGPTGYEGPGTSIKTDPALPDEAEIDFNGSGLAPGASAYFSLEGALTAASLTSSPGTLPSTGTCKRAFYLGARGSGEPGPGTKNWQPTKADANGFAPEVNNVYTGLGTDLGASNIEPESVKYDADSVTVLADRHDLSKYFRDLGNGVTQTLKDLKKQATLCPEQEIVLAGYSQGAMVMHRVLHQLGGSYAGQQILARVAAAVLIGDGDQVPFDNEIMDGSAWHIAQGVGQAFPLWSHSDPVKFSSNLRSRVIRVCNWGDVVCDFQNNPLSDAYGYHVHLHYANSKPLLQAIKQAAHDAQALNYYGGKLIVKGKVGVPISSSAVVIGGKLPLTVSPTIDGGEPAWLELGAAGDNTVTLGGTPSVKGSWTFDIAVQDAAGSNVLIPVSLTIK